MPGYPVTPDESPDETVTGGGRWGRHNDRRRALLLDAAVALIEEDAPGADLVVQQVAARAGLAKSVVYRQFSGRDDLERCVRSRIVEEFADMLDAQLSVWEGSARQILVRSVTAVADWMAGHPRLHDFLRTGPTAGGGAPDALEELKAGIADRAGQIVLALAGVVGVEDAAAVEVMPYALVSMCEGSLTRWARDPSPTLGRDEVVAEVVAYVWSVLDGLVRRHGRYVDPDVPLLEVVNQLAEDDAR